MSNAHHDRLSQAMPGPTFADDLGELDEGIDLPPLDQDCEEPEDNLEGEEELVPIDESDTSLDDEVAGDLDVAGDDIDEPLDLDPDTDDAEGEAFTDMGDIVFVEQEASYDDDTGLEVDDDVVKGEEELSGLEDGGSEGLDEDPGDDIREADLPELDDDEGEFEDTEFLPALSSGGDEGRVFQVALEAGSPLPCQSLSVTGGRLVAAGGVVLVVDDGALLARRVGAEGATSAVFFEQGIVLVSPKGDLCASDPVSGRLEELPGWQTKTSPARLATTPGRLWILADRTLWSLMSLRGSPTQMRKETVLAISSSGSSLVALTLSDRGPAIERLRADDELWEVRRLDGASSRIAEETLVELATSGSGRNVALLGRNRIAISRDGGASFASPETPDLLAACFAGDHPEAPLLALLGNEGGGAELVEIGSVAPRRTLIQLDSGGTQELLARPLALAWDSARDCLWLASARGLTAFQRQRNH